jgi:phosphohistidine phosphatase
MKNLILIRHAKSNWDAPLQDLDRPLDQRGMKDAHLVSSRILDFIPKTYVIWSSIAKRASDTALIFAQNILYPIECIDYKKGLYTFDEKQLEEVIKSCDNVFDSIIVLDIMPQLQTLSIYLATFLLRTPPVGLYQLNLIQKIG